MRTAITRNQVVINGLAILTDESFVILDVLVVKDGLGLYQ